MVSFKSIAAIALATFASLASAAPSPRASCRPGRWINLNFYGATNAPGDSYPISVKCGGEAVDPRDFGYTISVSHVSSSGGPCWIEGINGGELEFTRAGKKDFGPPQEITSVYCG